MFIVISIMFLGVGVGFLLRKINTLQNINSSIQYTIYLLLFLLGFSIGTNKQIINNFGRLGMEAIIISVASTLGSICMAWIVFRLFFKKRKEVRKDEK